MNKPFYEKPLQQLNSEEWEALCDGCGLCCLHKLEDEDSGEIFYTRVACELLDVKTCRCTDYENRFLTVPDCLKLTPAHLSEINWLPSTCAYQLRQAGKPLPAWHYLKTGSHASMHQARQSAAHFAEADIGQDLESAVLEENP